MDLVVTDFRCSGAAVVSLQLAQWLPDTGATILSEFHSWIRIHTVWSAPELELRYGSECSKDLRPTDARYWRNRIDTVRGRCESPNV